MLIKKFDKKWKWKRIISKFILAIVDQIVINFTKIVKWKQ
jgi:hypothetical protein